MQKRLVRNSLFLIILLLGSHLLAETFYWYVSIPVFDMVMHTLGGIFLAVFAGAFFYRHLQKLDFFESAVTVMLIVLVVGLGWEYFEYIVQYIIRGSTRLADVWDSISDVLCDMAGGVLGTIFVLMLKKGYNTSNGDDQK